MYTSYSSFFLGGVILLHRQPESFDKFFCFKTPGVFLDRTTNHLPRLGLCGVRTLSTEWLVTNPWRPPDSIVFYSVHSGLGVFISFFHIFFRIRSKKICCISGSPVISLSQTGYPAKQKYPPQLHDRIVRKVKKEGRILVFYSKR